MSWKTGADVAETLPTGAEAYNVPSAMARTLRLVPIVATATSGTGTGDTRPGCIGRFGAPLGSNVAENADRDEHGISLGPRPGIAAAEKEATRGERAPDSTTPFALRVKENLLLVVTALVMCTVFYVRQAGVRRINGVGAFAWCWLACYVVLILVLMLVHVLSAVADKYLFGEQDAQRLRETGHEPTIYACLAVLAASLVLLLIG